MNSFDDTLEDIEISVNGRRKRADKSQHARVKCKQARLSSGGKVPMISCKHRADDGFCWAEYLLGTDLSMNQDKFYDQTTKVEQDAYLLRLLDISEAKRKCVKEEDRKRARNTSTVFYLLSGQGQGKVRVCKATFCSVLGISQDRVTRVARWFNEKKEARPENRGGRRNAEADEEKRSAVQERIKAFKCKPSHYSRKSTPGRKYLPCELNVAKMHRMFLEQDRQLQNISYSTYHSVFTRDFNLGFGHPASDVCGTCTQFRTKVKDATLSDEQKKVLVAEFILHRRKARTFYNLMNNVEETITICFDVMENLVLPKTPVGQAYYSRQLYKYIFGIIIHRADGSQHKHDIHLFTWLECENRKDSNMIASALRHFLNAVLPTHLEGRSHLRLFSDSCFGQNKNMNMLSMLMAWRVQNYPALQITYTFPVRGHSFLPPDRVFGQIEQEIRTQNTILLPEDYHKIIANHGRVHRYNAEWHCHDFKKETAAFIKRARPFKLSEAKVMDMSCNGLAVKTSYSGEFQVHSVLKKGKRWENYRPGLLPPQSAVKPAKKVDVFKLLTEISAPENVVAFYESIIGNVDSDRTDKDTATDEDSDSY